MHFLWFFCFRRKRKIKNQTCRTFCKGYKYWKTCKGKHHVQFPIWDNLTSLLQRFTYLHTFFFRKESCDAIWSHSCHHVNTKVITPLQHENGKKIWKCFFGNFISKNLKNIYFLIHYNHICCHFGMIFGPF
jgi:hypothetical protein